jgi:hypothetical protein
VKAEFTDLPAMTDLANLIRRKAFYVMRAFNVESRGDQTLDQIAGTIAVSVLMDPKISDAFKATFNHYEG